MRYPSIKTLSALFGDNAKRARAIIDGSARKADNIALLEQAGYSNPDTLSPLDRRLLALNFLGEFHGVEYIPVDRDRDNYRDAHGAEYLNTGDTYALTVIYDHGRDLWLVQSIGDWIELAERRGVKVD